MVYKVIAYCAATIETRNREDAENEMMQMMYDVRADEMYYSIEERPFDKADCEVRYSDENSET